MLEMTQNINEKWQTHVGQTGVTCYTCHRGNNVPTEVWFKPAPDARANTFAGNRAGQNAPSEVVGLAALPNDPFSPYLLANTSNRVGGTTALPTGNRHSTKEAEWTYGLMMQMSDALGVNCTYCHNTRNFSSWGAESSPPRATAWHGIQMARQLNTDYLVPLTSTFPANRHGPTGDVAKVSCATCHQGANKPLYGAQMAANHPELLKTTATVAAATAAMAATPTAATPATPAASSP
jgi:photosynthetic reaction center cytochrome c subunit